ncbi:competence protein ComFC [Peptoclostridium litorale DSM 5388]|uniref:Phosphoribosyl transferase domain-containing protein n=1 Tax=Peptoclostridium litorale DSM 5388 TaxID=1121324 RepID=A0A069RKJ7_PEPLI|nr:ComF family protein [Peptoclostridium litorale]KDR94752.1 phosphoribosyl transferase domain-containing protein [Peptoclostridium litorale DSM 5388]SIN91894.1 competence protein ComFC [Peptoclostridium litorale DSM 5388]
MDFIRSLADAALELVFPSGIKCICCGEPIPKGNTYSLCKHCFDSLRFIKNGCEKCGKPIPEEMHERLCSSCMDGAGRLNFDRAVCCMEYDDLVHRMIYAFKYGKKTFMGKYLAGIIMDKLEYEQMDFEIIVPVPLSKKRLRARGFNQAKIMADELSRFCKKPCKDILERTRDTDFLSGLSRYERKKELKGVFTLNEYSHNIISNRNILVVDDILTTGSTSSEIAITLKEGGAEGVYVICLATGRNIY